MNLKTLYHSITKNINLFSKTKSKVLEKFLVDAVYGILGGKSVHLSMMARTLEGRKETTAKYIYKRLNRAIGDYDTTEVKERVQGMQSGMVDENTLIYFDPTEVTKRYGKKFEQMGKIADGSDKHAIKSGYPVNVCIGLRGEEVIPLELNIYSPKEEQFQSENDELIKPIEAIAHRSGFKGKYVLDRGFDRFAIFRFLMGLSLMFIVRLKETRHFYPKGYHLQSFTREETIRKFTEKKVRVFLDIRVKKRLVKKCFSIRACRVELHSWHIDSDLDIWLIQAKASDALTLYLLTNIQEINEESLVSIVQAYLDRWKVEEFIRFVKQEYGMESFLVRDLGRIKNLFNLLFIAIVILTRISELNISFSRTRALLIKYAKRVFKIPQKMKFFLYTLADGLAHVLNIITEKTKRLLFKKPDCF